MEQFSDAKYVSVRSFKRSGDAVSTPVWPVVIDGKLYFGTPEHTYKVKRIRNDPKVQIAVSDSKGKVSSEWSDGIARVIDGAEFAPYKKELDKKYRFSAKMMGVFAKIRRWNYVGVVVEPA